MDYRGLNDGDRESSSTDMEAALVQASLRADRQIIERGAVVTHDPLPRVTGDLELLTKVLHHLIKNAIEYCVAPSPRVQISSRRADLDRVFSVADNRPGIEPVFQQRIFGLSGACMARNIQGTGSTSRPGRPNHSMQPIDVKCSTVILDPVLASSNYEVQFAPESALSERVLFPVKPSQSNGIEDARFVLFQQDDGTRTYYATYTAYDGRMILPQFLETSDFLRFKFITLNGHYLCRGSARSNRRGDGIGGVQTLHLS